MSYGGRPSLPSLIKVPVALTLVLVFVYRTCRYFPILRASGSEASFRSSQREQYAVDRAYLQRRFVPMPLDISLRSNSFLHRSNILRLLVL